MSSSLSRFALGFLIAGLSLAPSFALGADAKEPSREEAQFFEQKIRPLLAANCFKCHGPDKQKGDLRLDSLAGMLTGGESGAAIVSGKPEESHLIEAINYASWEMPPDGKLDDKSIALLTSWVKMGAPWPNSKLPSGDVAGKPKEKITAEDRAFWSFQPVRRPAVPQTDDGGWSHGAIDAFVWQKLKSEGLSPADEAGKLTLLRRASFDLIGLPPTVAEIEAFLADESPQAYEILIDRLLASPRYGERWARHWLDLVRFAESDGHKADGFRPEAWRYRDYVIRAFNEDKPYDRFVREQLAGDELAPDDPEALTATGYLRTGLYEYNQRNVRRHWADILNDITDVTADVFLGMGMGCARCHDHKYDPILQKDYYRLQAFFTPLVHRDDVPLATADELAEYRRKLAAWQEKTADIREQMAAIERPAIERVTKGAISKFPDDIQVMMNKAAGERLPLEEQLHQLAFRQVVYEHERLTLKGADKEKHDALRAKLVEFDKLKPEPLPLGLTVTDVGAAAPPTYIAGDKKQEDIEPGYLTVLTGGEPAKIEPVVASGNTAGNPSTGRRTALARWLTQPDNPLTARVMVNRVWQYHFGQGLVATSSDFGTLGEPPSHPELLDWLAAEFVEQGWSIKHLHRLMMTSATYRQSALRAAPAVALKKDPDNRWLWRMNIRRLGAEQIRDAALAATGELDLSYGGMSVATSKPRRTIYSTALRNTRDPLLDAFDLPDGFGSTPQRNITTTPTQALLMINGDWLLERAKGFARRLERENPSHAEQRIDAAYRLAYGRLPTPQQRQAALAFLQRSGQRDRDAADAPPVPVVQAMPERGGYAAVIEPKSKQDRLRVSDAAAMAEGDFTVEAFVILRSLAVDATVRTIVSQWDGDNNHPGWSLGVTSEKSKFTPRNLILQMVGDPAKGGSGYEVISSGLHVELNKPYYVAVTVRVEDTSESGVTFYLKDLSDDLPLQTASAVHQATRHFQSPLSLMIGGRDSTKPSNWDGLIDDVRVTAAALSQGELLIEGAARHDKTVGYWRFENEPGFFRDSSGNNLDIAPRAGGKAPANEQATALVDFCHVLLNSNEFLYVD